MVFAKALISTSRLRATIFFCLYFLSDEARLTVKPMYADDLWWNILDASDNKKEPLSLRGTGAYSLSGQILTSDEITKVTDKEELTDIIDGMFKNATDAISKFIIANPNADSFFPDESKMDYDPDRLLYLMALIHNGKEEDGSNRISGAWIFRKVLNLQHENCRCNMDVPSRWLERTVRDSPVRTN